MRSGKKTVVVIVGPTAAGKSALAVKLAKRFDGEVISADSRQVYRGLDIGSGKVPRDKIKPKSYNLSPNTHFHQGVPHHLLDVASPKRTFTVSHYQKLARQKIKEIIARGKLPIICGGTGFYIDAVVNGTIIPPVAPNQKLRQKLEKLSNKELFKKLKGLDPARAKTIDPHNPRRLIRAIEIATALGRVPPLKPQPLPHQVIKLGLKVESKKLKVKIKTRLAQRLRQGLIVEVRGLHDKTGLSWKRLESFGLEYRYVARYLKHQLTRSEMITQLESEIWHYAKRQMTWFKRDKKIRWVNPKKIWLKNLHL